MQRLTRPLWGIDGWRSVRQGLSPVVADHIFQLVNCRAVACARLPTSLTTVEMGEERSHRPGELKEQVLRIREACQQTGTSSVVTT
jgi:hypothetical protein